jgi:serine/threonine protein phosphatase 1
MDNHWKGRYITSSNGNYYLNKDGGVEFSFEQQKEYKRMRTLVMGDVHGGFKAMKHALEEANFDYENDRLICLGDVVDGWSQTKEVIDELLKIKKLVYLLGNHDEWALEYYNGETRYSESGPVIAKNIWTSQGGQSTLESLGTYNEQDPKYLEFLKSGKLYYEIINANPEGENDRIIFAHGNIPNQMYNMKKLVEKEETWHFIWERHLIKEAARQRNSKKWIDKRFKEIYLGHSAVSLMMPVEEHQWKPQKMTNIIAMDTNAGYDGKVSIMDIKTKEIFQSDFVCKYYPDERGRNGESYNEYLARQVE